MPTLEQLAYELALRALGQQEAALVELRSRTGTLLAASALTASFLGAPALSGGLDVPVALALAAFVAVVLISTSVLLPKDDLTFALAGANVHEALRNLDVEEAHRLVAQWLERLRARNQPTVGRLRARFAWASGSLIAQTLLLALGLAVD
ncbi:MAG: hypothetical protein QOE65_2292 [Solirubrobacteraceae bacterium]|jgi:hypothetical protein|nr:hypothetical protein [Solirubrobacteraceae bacterium]